MSRDSLTDNPITRKMQGEWHKIAALIMKKLGVDEVIITPQDLIRLGYDTVIIVREQQDGLHIKVTTEMGIQQG